MRTHALLLGLIVLTAGLAGCIGSGDDGGDGSGDDPIEPSNTTDPGDGTGEDAAPATRSWTNETIEGSVDGVSAPGVASFSTGDVSQSFTAPSGVDVLYLNLTADSVQMTIGGPDCDIGGNTVPPCAETISGGETYRNETPSSGEWQLEFQPSGPVAQGASYTVDVVQGVLAAGDG